jgi:hypothetical protein
MSNVNFALSGVVALFSPEGLPVNSLGRELRHLPLDALARTEYDRP